MRTDEQLEDDGISIITEARTDMTCTGCDAKVRDGLFIDQDDSSCVVLCKDCLRNFAARIDGAS